MSVKKEHEILCVDCGKYFLGTYAFYCPECRNKRRAETAIKLAKRYAEKRKGNEYGYDEHQSAVRLAALVAKRRAGGKYLKPEICPNYDKTSVTCVMCPAGAFKFKACGSGK